MTKEEKKLVAIFVVSMLFGLAVFGVGLWAYHALLAHFMGAAWAVIVIASSYVVGTLSGLAALKNPDGSWRFNGWCACTIRKFATWELDLLGSVVQALKGPKKPETTAEVVDAATAE